MVSIISLSPLAILAILVYFTIMGKVSYGHGLADIVYIPLPFLLLFAQFCVVCFVKSNVLINIFSTTILLLSFALIVKMTIRRGLENVWKGRKFPFIKSTAELMDKQVLRDFDKLIKKHPDNEDLKQKKKLFIEHNGNKSNYNT